MRIELAPGLFVDPSELVERFVRASGPGGQNVNKVATAVELRFDVRASPGLPEDLKRRLLAAAGQLATSDGVLVLFAQSHRSQARNREDALARLSEMVAAAAVRPVRRRATRPTFGSQLRRLDGKTRRGRTKRDRNSQHDE